MTDQEYSEYLKSQSYDNLVSISCLLDQEAHPGRYQMVLAELAVRDQRGEKPRTNWHGRGSLIVGVFFIVEFIFDLIMSIPGWKPVIHLAIGSISLTIAWLNRTKDKDEKPST